jgi:nucleoside-triphosphatase
VEHTVAKNLLISGASGSGKTSVIRDVTLARKSRIGGFYTEPIMAGRMRKGLMIRTLDGQDRMLASKTVRSPHTLGKFPVDINALENVGIPALRLALMTKDMVVIDEIGTLEAMSQRFKETLLECLHSTKPILATVRASASPFTDQLKKMPDTQTISLNKSNLNAVKQQIRKWMDAHL